MHGKGHMVYHENKQCNVEHHMGELIAEEKIRAGPKRWYEERD